MIAWLGIALGFSEHTIYRRERDYGIRGFISRDPEGNVWCS
jgi:hypothetical protein